MSSTADSERPAAVSEEACDQMFTCVLLIFDLSQPFFWATPLLDHITTDPPEDSYPDSESPAKLKNAKNIGTTTPEVEGEDNGPVTAVEDYPSTPVSTMDSSFQPLPLTGESKEDSIPLSPAPEEPEFGAGKEAGAAGLPSPIEAEEKQLDGAEEPKVEVLEDSDKAGNEADSILMEGREVVEADEKVGVPESSETEQGSSGDKAVDPEAEDKSLETPVEMVEEGSTSEAAVPELDALEEGPSEAALKANQEGPAAVDETPTALDASDLGTEVLKTAEPVEENDDESRDTPAAEEAESVAEKLSSEIANTEHQDTTGPQTIQDSELTVDEPKAGEAAYESGEDDKVQQEHEAEEIEHSEATEPAMGRTVPNTEAARHTHDAVMEVVGEKREDEEVEPGAEKTDTTIGDHESRPELEADSVAETDSVPCPNETSVVVEGSKIAQPRAEDSEAKDAPELVAPSGAEGIEAEPKTTETTEAEPPTPDVSIFSTGGEDTPNSQPATESTGDAKEGPRSETDELFEVKPQAPGVLPVTEPLRDGDEFLPVEAGTETGGEHTEGPKDGVRVEAEYEVEEEPEFEAAEVSEPVDVEPAVPNYLPLTEAPKEGEVPTVDVDTNPRPVPAGEDEKGVPGPGLLVEGLARTAEETVGSALEEPKAQEGAGAPPDDGPIQELKEPVATEPEVLAVPGETKELQSASEFTEQSVERVEEVGPEPGIPKDNEQGTQGSVQATPISDMTKPEESELGPTDTENPPVADVEDAVPVETHEGSDVSTVLKTEDISADAGPEASIEGSGGTTKTEPVANGEGGDLAQDEPIVVSHGDAPPDEVERAEAAVDYPKPDPQDEVAEAPSEIEVEKDGKPPVSPVQAQMEPEGIKEVAEIAAGSSSLNEPQSFESPGDIAPERAPTPKVAEEENLEESETEGLGAVALGGVNDKAKEPTSSKEPEETPIAQEISHPVGPVGETHEESVGGSSVDSGIKLDQGFHEGVVTSDLTIPEKSLETLLLAGEGVTPAVQPGASKESQPGEQMFSVSPLPDSKTFGNPIDLQPGEPIPVCLTEASVADNVKIDEEIFKKFDDKTAKAEEPNDGSGEKILAAGAGAGLVGLGAYAAVKYSDDKTKAGKHNSENASSIPASPSDSKAGDDGSPAVDVSAKSIPSTAQEQVLPVEVSFPSPAIAKELSESPVVSKTEVEPARPVGKSTEEITKPAGAEVLGENPLQASATDIPNESTVNQPVGKSVSHNGDEVTAEPAPKNALSPVHGVMALEEHIPEVLKDTETSETPAIVVSAPPNPATGSSTAEVIQPSSSEVVFDEASAKKARESGEIFAHPVWNESVSPLLQYSLENTPEGVRRRRAPGSGGEVSRPTSSGTDNVSTRHHRNIMNGFWHVVLFGWLGGFGRFFGGIFSKSKSRKQRR
ncbi:unnamed protein product [Tuber aestivum]|uniref:Uncharacterized protein n=1 Tax=Tuber aestivum TaxID=59557 RepID=A0A292Q5J4_9PEZI|nr:unnamed protein product [Tuber aestivum]